MRLSSSYRTLKILNETLHTSRDGRRRTRCRVGDALGQSVEKVGRGFDLVGRAVDRDVGGGDVVALGLVGHLAHDEAAPKVVVLLDDLQRVGLVLGLAVEGELVGRLAGRHLVGAQPLVDGERVARHEALHVVNVVERRRQRVGDVDHEHLPVGLALVDQRNDAEHLDLLDLAAEAVGRADLAHVERVVVAERAGLGVLVRRVLPRLREGAVVPHVASVREDIIHMTQLAVLDILL